MINKFKAQPSRLIILVLYLAATLAFFLYQWHGQNNGEQGPLYRDLMSYPAYVKRGFNQADISPGNFNINNGWVRFQSGSLLIRDSSLPDMPKNSFSFHEKPVEEFTILIQVEMDTDAMNFLDSDLSIVPGIFLGQIGENWEIYLNGRLVRSEMHISESGQIKTRRVMAAEFPLEKSLITGGTNILAFRILGSPFSFFTGLDFQRDHYIDDYRIIERRNQNFLYVVLAGFFGSVGVFYLLLFLSVKRKEELYNLFYGIFSILLCINSTSASSMIYYFILDTDIILKISIFSQLLLFPSLGLVIETTGRGKVTITSKIFTAVCLFLSSLLFVMNLRSLLYIIHNLQILMYIYMFYVFFYDVIYYNFFEKKRTGNNGNMQSDWLNFHIRIGTVLIVIACSSCLMAAFGFSFFFNAIDFQIYSIFVLQIGMFFSMFQRFNNMNTWLEESNIILEAAVSRRTEELKKQTEIALLANQAKSRFLATMSHEIRTPLNAVIGLSEIVLTRGKLLDDSRNDIQQIHRSGSSLLGIINDILDVSKIEAGGFKINPAEYETASLINDTVNQNVVRIGSKPITFVLEIDGDFPRKLFGDELRVKQILTNILSNAIKYTQKGKIILAVSWEYCCIMGHISKKEVILRFTVQDSGIGIRLENIDKLFTDYTQLDAKENRDVEGTGLGLAISKKLVEMMGGNITVTSKYGHGSTFTVTIIQGLVEGKGIGEEIAEKLKQFHYRDLNSEKIIDHSWMPYGKVLVVDDVPVNLQVVKGLLEPYGIKVYTAASGQEAVDKVCSGKKYDLVFMDHMMPVMDGIEAVRNIRVWEDKQPQKTRVPIIALTANALVGNIEMFLSKGFDGFLAKPVEVVELDAALNSWIRDKQSPETLLQAEKKEDKEQDKQMNNTSLKDIPGVDMQHGIALSGGTTAKYCTVLSMFCEDAEERLPFLKTAPVELQVFT
ncbi:MAG: response regulator, partial [Treponema sp.]|nr:response regulator [Treponema sp.]